MLCINAQEYGLTVQEKLTIGQGICTPLLKKIRADLQRNIEESEETVNRLNPRYNNRVLFEKSFPL